MCVVFKVMQQGGRIREMQTELSSCARLGPLLCRLFPLVMVPHELLR